uniref:Uncharacterized protein LOC105110455 n=1 Tax=Rhizophora mucronata TaxID=61149 RepID=A0A2P2KEB6_RHIMU
MHFPRTLITGSSKQSLKSLLLLSFNHRDNHLASSSYRSISSTTTVGSWMDSIKGIFTGNKKEGDPMDGAEAFTLLRFADFLKKAEKMGSFKNFLVGRSSQATFSDAFGKTEMIIRYLGRSDSTGENLQTSQKQEAAKQCNCTLADVENALAKFTWAKEAQNRLQKLKEEGKPMPKSFAEVQKLMGSTPLDLARSNLAKSGQLSRNALCPCGSKKRYKRCCGQARET